MLPRNRTCSTGRLESSIRPINHLSKFLRETCSPRAQRLLETSHLPPTRHHQPIPMAPPPLSFKNASFSNFSAFSTAASPLRNSFTLSCRSPITPTPGGRQASSTPRHGSFLEPPRSLTGPGAKSGLSTVTGNGGYAYDEDDESASIDSPTDQTWFLPHSPGLPPRPSLAQQDEGKLGVLSAINIIVGKTMGVGAYTVPSAIFSGVGSVGSKFIPHFIFSIILETWHSGLGVLLEHDPSTSTPPHFC